MLLPDGSLPDGAAAVMDVAAALGAAGAVLPTHAITLLAPLPGSVPARGAGGSGSGGGRDAGVSTSLLQGHVSLKGQLHAIAYVAKRENMERAAETLRADLQVWA
eukprot:360502-Chlamydomonas_euryale.AAC.2